MSGDNTSSKSRAIFDIQQIRDRLSELEAALRKGKAAILHELQEKRLEALEEHDQETVLIARIIFEEWLELLRHMEHELEHLREHAAHHAHEHHLHNHIAHILHEIHEIHHILDHVAHAKAHDNHTHTADHNEAHTDHGSHTHAEDHGKEHGEKEHAHPDHDEAHAEGHGEEHGEEGHSHPDHDEKHAEGHGEEHGEEEHAHPDHDEAHAEGHGEEHGEEEHAHPDHDEAHAESHGEEHGKEVQSDHISIGKETLEKIETRLDFVISGLSQAQDELSAQELKPAFLQDILTERQQQAPCSFEERLGSEQDSSSRIPVIPAF